MNPSEEQANVTKNNGDLLSPRTTSLLREHAKALGVDEAKLASDLLEMMVQDRTTPGERVD